MAKKLMQQENGTFILRTPPVNEHTEVLLDVVQKLSLATDLETIMFIVRKAARKLTGSDGATFVLRDNEQCFYADEDAIAPLWKGKRFPLQTCVSGWVMEHREAVVIPDIYADPRVPAEAYRTTFVKSLAMVPIRTAAPLGAIGTYWADYYEPTAEQLDLLKALADSTSIALQNLQLHAELAQGHQQQSLQVEATNKLKESHKNLEDALTKLNCRNQEMLWLKELSSSLQTCFYIDEAYQSIVQYAQKLLPQAAGLLYLMHPSRNYLEAMLAWGEPLANEKIIKPEECLALRRGSAVNHEHNLPCAHQFSEHAFPSMCIPLYAQSDIIGLFYLEWQHHDPCDDNQEVLAGMIAEQIALGISNIQLRETLRNQSFRDALTDLYNRRYLEETLDREISRCARKDVSLAILMLDIDHFKQFNDQFGHEAGDMVIQQFANVLRNFARKDDIACRYGGEEFLLVIPEMELAAMKRRTQALHEAVSHIHLRYGGKALPPITISIGLAMFPVHGKNRCELIAAADMALYDAKNSGRNRTEIYAPQY